MMVPQGPLLSWTSILEFSRPENFKMPLGELKRNKPAKQSIRPSFQNFCSTLVPEPRLESPKASLEATTSILEFSRPENFKMALGELKRNKPAKQSIRPSFQNFRSTLVPEPRLESPKASLEATTSILEFSRPENFKMALGELKRNKPAKQSIRPSFQNFRSTLVPEPRLESPKASLEATTSILEFSRPENFKMALGELKRNKPAKQSIRPSFQNFRSTLVPEPRLESPKASLEATTSILEFSRPENFKMALGELKRNKPAKQSIRPSFQNFRSTLVPEPRLESPKASLEATTSILEFSRPENFKMALGELKRNKPAKQSIRPSFQNFRSTLVPEPRLESPKASLEATTSILEFSRPENFKMALGELKRNKPAKQSIRPSFQNFRSTLVPEPRLESPKASLEATTSILEFSRPENFKMALGELKRNKPAKQSIRPSFQNFCSTLVPEPRLESPKASLEATTSILEFSRPENFKMALGELKRNKPAKQSIRPSFQNFRSTLVPEPRLESPKASLEATTSILEFSRPENFKMALGELKRNKPAKQSIRPSFQNFRSTLVPEPRLESPKASLEATTSILEFSRPENFKMALGELKRNKPAKQSIRPSFQNFRSTLVPEPRLESPKASLEATTSILEFSRPENFKMALGELKRNKPAKQSIRPSFQNFRSTLVPEPRLESPKASLEATTSILEFSRPENSKMEVC